MKLTPSIAFSTSGCWQEIPNDGSDWKELFPISCCGEANRPGLDGVTMVANLLAGK